MIKSPDEPLWDTVQAAEYLGVKPRTLRWLRSKGEAPPCLMVGGVYRYVPGTVRAWVKERESIEQIECSA